MTPLAPQGRPDWPLAPSPVERLASWVEGNEALRRRTRLAGVRALSGLSRVVGLTFGLVLLAGLAGIGLAAAKGQRLAGQDVLACGVVGALWLGNRWLRNRWQAKGWYVAPTKGRSLLPFLRPAVPRSRGRPTRSVRRRRDH